MPITMLNRWMDTYGQVTPDDVEKNCNLLSAEWNPNNPTENFWLHIPECQAFARPIEPITNSAVLRLALTAVFERTGVFPSAVKKWRNKPTADQALVNFTTHFNFEIKEHVRKLTAKQECWLSCGTHQAKNIVPGLLPSMLLPYPSLQLSSFWQHSSVALSPYTWSWQEH